MVPVTVLPTKLQTVGVVLLNVTGNPDGEADAVQVLVPLTAIEVGVQDTVTVWLSLFTTTVAVTGSAGS